MTDLLDLVAAEHDDPELVPIVRRIDSRLSLRGNTRELARMFQHAADVLPTKEVTPNSAYAMLEVVPPGDGMSAYARITASDGQQVLSVVGGSISSLTPGSALVPAKKIADCLRSVDTDQVLLHVVGNTAVLTRPDGSTELSWEYRLPERERRPQVPDVERLPRHVVPTKQLLGALLITRRAAAPDSHRKWMTEVLVRGGALTGFDHTRLHQQRIPGLPEDLDFAIPPATVDTLIRTLKASDSEHLRVGSDERFLVFEIDNDFIVAQKLMIDYPDISKHLLEPALRNTVGLTVDRHALMTAIKRVRLVADQKWPAVTLTAVQGATGDWQLAVSADSTLSSGQEVIAAEFDGRRQYRMQFHHRYLLDLLWAQGGDDVRLLIGSSDRDRLPLYIDNPRTGFTGFIYQVAVGNDRRTS